MQDSPMSFATALVHAGERDNFLGAVATPIFETATFGAGSLAEYQALEEDMSGLPSYTRGYNPTVGAFEQKLAAVEGAERCLAFNTGMTAISTLLMHLSSRLGHVITSEHVFGTTRLLLGDTFPELGFNVTFVDLRDPRNLTAALESGARAVFLEFFTNPLLHVLDLPTIVDRCHDAGALVIVDNTFLSPYAFLPLEHGADLVVHSTTKYIAGHGRVLGGALLGSDELLTPVAELRRRTGGIMTPHNAASMLDGIKTLAVREARQCESALALATSVAAHPAVTQVNYPGLPDHPSHDLAAALVGESFGGVFSFAVANMATNARNVFDAFRLVTRATSLGDVVTLCDYVDGWLRISVGLEDIDDLRADVLQALDTVAR